MKKFSAEMAKNARALKWMGAATLLELGVLALAGVLHFMRLLPDGAIAAGVVALPGVVLTVFLPGMRDAFREKWGLLAVFMLTFALILGLTTISAQFYDGGELVTVWVVGVAGIVITSVVAWLDAKGNSPVNVGGTPDEASAQPDEPSHQPRSPEQRERSDPSMTTPEIATGAPWIATRTAGPAHAGAAAAASAPVGSTPGLIGHWIKWLLVSVITLGIYSFWVYPRLQK